jgi:hypothetical protein
MAMIGQAGFLNMMFPLRGNLRSYQPPAPLSRVGNTNA